MQDQYAGKLIYEGFIFRARKDQKEQQKQTLLLEKTLRGSGNGSILILAITHMLET